MKRAEDRTHGKSALHAVDYPLLSLTGQLGDDERYPGCVGRERLRLKTRSAGTGLGMICTPRVIRHTSPEVGEVHGSPDGVFIEWGLIHSPWRQESLESMRPVEGLPPRQQ